MDAVVDVLDDALVGATSNWRHWCNNVALHSSIEGRGGSKQDYEQQLAARDFDFSFCRPLPAKIARVRYKIGTLWSATWQRYAPNRSKK